MTTARLAVVIIAIGVSVAMIKIVPDQADKVAGFIFGTVVQSYPSWIRMLLSVLFSFFVLTVIFPFILTVGWMFLERKKNALCGSLPFVSVIIPAFNEEKAILRSLNALSKLDYPMFEVIVINDGSTDFTFTLIEQAKVKYIHLRNNQGKSAALNAGIAEAKGSILVFSDSDSWLDPMAIRYLVEGFTSHHVGAVSGSVEIDRETNLLRRWQTIEYSFGQVFIKAAQLGSGSSVAICPGPVCAFRKEIVLKIGGFRKRTITEDFDATLEVIGQGHTISYAPKAVAYTEAPDRWAQLKRQRLRWFRGHIQTFKQHRGLFFQPRYGMLGFYWLPFYYLFLGYICGLIELVTLPFIIILHVISADRVVMFKLSLVYCLLAILFMSCGYAFVLYRSDKFRLSLMVAAILMFPYTLFLNWLRIWAIFNEIRGKVSTWSG